MLMTINRCIDYTKASRGIKLVPRYETIDLMESLSLPLNCMRNIQHRIEIVLHEVSKEICSHIITDKQWLQENVLCLLSNAVKYSTEGMVTISIRLETTQRSTLHSPKADELRLYSAKKVACSSGMMDDNEFVTRKSCVVIEIEDTGIGMSEEAMSSLFNPFKQTQRLAGGTGLGLFSLAKRMESLQGEYGVSRRKDGKKGSLFWFSFPYKPDESLASSVSQIDELSLVKDHTNLLPDSMSVPRIKNLHILLVDDSLPIVKMTVKTLEKLGHRIDTAENGEVALRMVEQRWIEKRATYDIVLMDLQMPVMDGLEATRRIRRLETNNSNIHNFAECQGKAYQRIIGLSANSDNDTTEAAFQAGIDRFMPKPFKIESFHEMVRQLGLNA